MEEREEDEKKLKEYSFNFFSSLIKEDEEEWRRGIRGREKLRVGERSMNRKGWRKRKKKSWWRREEEGELVEEEKEHKLVEKEKEEKELVEKSGRGVGEGGNIKRRGGGRRRKKWRSQGRWRR